MNRPHRYMASEEEAFIIARFLAPIIRMGITPCVWKFTYVYDRLVLISKEPP
jgi:hypothetical protein